VVGQAATLQIHIHPRPSASICGFNFVFLGGFRKVHGQDAHATGAKKAPSKDGA
jgi:hypothetical protein